MLPAAPSESLACKKTVELAGPSGKVQSKVGATFAIVIVCVASFERALSESLTLTAIVELLGPSGNVQSKLPPPTVGVPTREPFAPQVGYVETKLKESPSASAAVKA